MPKKVLIIVPCLGYGGAERQISYLAPYLRRELYEVHIISMIQPLAVYDAISENDIPVHVLHFVRGKISPAGLYRFLRLVKQRSFEIVITFNFPANFLGRLAKLFYPKIRLVTSIRNITFGSLNREKIIKLSKNYDAYTVCNSTTSDEYFRKRGVIAPGKSKVIKNALNLENFQPSFLTNYELKKELCRSLAIPEASFVWLNVARLDPSKDHFSLLNALKIMRDNYNVVGYVIIIGSGLLEQQLTDHAVQSAVADQVRFLGKKNNVIEYYRALDGFLLSSSWEGLPNVIMEAMAIGMPIVCTKAGGSVELVQDMVNGRIVDIESPGQLAEAMASVMKLDKVRIMEISKANSKKIHEEYAPEKILPRWLEMLSRL